MHLAVKPFSLELQLLTLKLYSSYKLYDWMALTKSADKNEAYNINLFLPFKAWDLQKLFESSTFIYALVALHSVTFYTLTSS